MFKPSSAKVAALSIVAAAAFIAVPAGAQTTSSNNAAQSQNQGQNQGGSNAGGTNPFLASLAEIVVQSFTPKVGGTVPQHVKTQPMPQGAAKAMPGLKDHHVAKADKNTVVIAHPDTRKIVGVISTDGSTASTATPNASGTNAGNTGNAANATGGTNTQQGTTNTQSNTAN